MSLEDFQSRWLRRHAPLVMKHASALRIRRYIQAHVRPNDPMGQMLQQIYGTQGEPYDGVAELWWDDTGSLASSTATDESRKASRELLEDEGNFIDFSRSVIFVAEEYSVVV